MEIICKTCGKHIDYCLHNMTTEDETFKQMENGHKKPFVGGY